MIIGLYYCDLPICMLVYLGGLHEEDQVSIPCWVPGAGQHDNAQADTVLAQVLSLVFTAGQPARALHKTMRMSASSRYGHSGAHPFC